MRLAERKILVTGAGSGIGSAIGELFHREGATLALVDMNKAALASVAARLPGTHAFACDVSASSRVATVVAEAAKALGGLDGVINVAGVDLYKKFEDTTDDEWARVIAVNLSGPILVTRAALPFLKAASDSAIVNISSGAGLRPLVNRSAYCASKAGLIMLSKALALELAPANVRVNVICPGVVDTPLLRGWYEQTDDPEEARREARSRPAMARLGEASEIAYAALHLVSIEARYTTGSTLTVDGGRAFH